MSQNIDYSKGIYDARQLGAGRMLILGVQHMFAMFGATVLVPLLTRFCGLEQRQAFSTSLAVILPLCVLSAAVYLFRGGRDLLAALPYLIGGTVGGWLGGRWFRGVRVVWLRRAFGLLLLYGGARCLL